MNTFDKSALPSKVLLSGADCFHLVLDKHARKNNAGGNVMRKVFHFNQPLNKESIAAILQSSPVIYWLCNIRLVQKVFQAPYWQYTNAGNNIIVNEHHVQQEREIPRTILNRDITLTAKRFIETDLIHYPSGKSTVVISWNHILLDAKGTSLLFDQIGKASTQLNPGSLFPAAEQKVSFSRYIKNMYAVKAFIQHSSRAPVSSVARGFDKKANTTLQSHIVSFSAEESALINANAIKAGSRFGPNLYFISCCAHAIHGLNEQRNNPGDIWLPVPYDGRLKGATGPVISNNVSFLFYRILHNELGSVTGTVATLAKQMSDQIRDKMPQKYSMFLNMMRYVPLWLYYFLINNTGEGTFASFLYTTTGENFSNMETMFGLPVEEIEMIPALTYPPGLTFVFLKHNNKLNINIAYAQDVISNNELLLVEQKLRSLLLSDHS